MTTTIVIAKEPVAGRVKTRLVPPLSYGQAAAVAAAALADTLDAVDLVASDERVLAFSGDPSTWRRRGWRVAEQPPGGLDVRLAAAFAACPPAPAVLVGMDTPQLRPEHLAGFDPSRFDACLGPAADGGYWAIGFAEPALAAAAILGVPMSSAGTAAAQRRRLAALGLRVQLLELLTDVDDIATAEAVAADAPETRFAEALARVRTAA
jgi:glycosyltransferase A (GT-A) superfamily protein (DUF2064 family)